MESLRLNASEDTPEVHFNLETGVFTVTGRALPEDAHDFFSPIEKWTQEYMLDPLDSTTVELRIDYFNSASTRYIFNILMSFEDLVEAGKDVKVIWFYKADDEMIEAKGEELESILELPFEMRTL
jgi:hypothetical protein